MGFTYNLSEDMDRPRRARGVKPQKTAEELAQEEKMYSSLFGQEAFQEEEEVDLQEQKRQEERQKRKQLLKNNTEKHPYVRAHHYYFNVEEFSRLQGHPSYIVDNNMFNWTYSRENKEIGGQTVSNLINRVYVGLPVEVREEKKEKENEDRLTEDVLEREEKKYGYDRMIYTCDKIMKHMQKFVRSGKIVQFKSIAKRQPQLELLALEDVSVQEKMEILSQTIEELKRKKLNIIKKELGILARAEVERAYDQERENRELQELGGPSKKIKEE